MRRNWNRTKIVATIGPASRRKTVLRAMIRAGVDVFRINGAFGDSDCHRETMAMVRSAAALERAMIAILLDLPGPKHRLGKLIGDEVRLKSGETATLACGRTIQRDEKLPLPIENLCRVLKRGDAIFINDGIVELRVLEIRGRDIKCRVKAGGPVRSGKGVNFPRVALNVPALTSHDKDLVRLAVSEEVDFLGLSFVRSAKNIKTLRGMVARRAPDTRIVAKIEKPEALDDLDNIIDATDAVMVARGDLGIEMPFNELPHIQRYILDRCLRAGKPSITATQMLESMVNSARPTRAEATDVALAVWEGTDAVMLSEETSMGINPVGAVRAMAKIARDAEENMSTVEAIVDAADRDERQAVALSCSASTLAQKLGAKAIVIPTRSGRTPLYVSRSRRKTPIIALTENSFAARRMALYWGVIPVPMPSFKTVDEMLNAAAKIARRQRYIKKGDSIVIVSGAHGTKDDITRLVEVRKV